MKILMLDKYLEVGGVATFLEILAKGLIERGHSVYLITATDDKNEIIIEQFRNRGVEVLTVPYSENRLIVANRFLKHSLQLLKNVEIDLIHSQHRLTHFTAIAAGKISNTPRLLSLHVFKKDHKLLTKFWKNEFITVPSRALKKHLVDYNALKDDHIEVIHNTIHPDYEVDQQRVNSMKKRVFNEDKMYVSYIGRLSPEKGVDTLIESIPLVQKKNAGVAFRIFGPGPELPALKKRCEELDLETDKIFQGFQPHVNEVLYLTDICVSPSRSESFSLFALECMRAGKPMIAANVGGLPEVVTDGKTGMLIEPDNAAALAEKILFLCNDEKMRVRLSKEAKKRFKSNFSIKSFHKSYIYAYKKIL